MTVRTVGGGGEFGFRFTLESSYIGAEEESVRAVGRLFRMVRRAGCCYDRRRSSEWLHCGTASPCLRARIDWGGSEVLALSDVKLRLLSIVFTARSALDIGDP